MLNEKQVVRSSLFKKAGIPHGFYTKNYGAFPSHIDTSKFPDPETLADPQVQNSVVQINEDLESQALALPTQIHSASIWQTDQSKGEPIVIGPKADAAVSNMPELAVGIRTADCVPILLSTKDGSVVAAVHGGWRGLEGGIIGKAIDVFISEYGATPEKLLAAIGPAIGPCCFEIGDEVVEKFRALPSWHNEFLSYPQKRPHLDLPAIAREELRQCGLNEKYIENLGICTKCPDSNYYSYRRHGADAGRQVSAISCKR